MMNQPSTPDVHGRQPGGRFAPGNKFSKGNPYAQQVARLRSALMEAVTPEKLASVVQALIREAEGGNIPAIKELLDRVLGRPVEADLFERIGELENLLMETRR